MRRAPLITLAAAALALGACGSSADEPSRVSGDTLTIYASLPSHGAEASAGADAELGMRRALADAGGRAGGRRVRLVRLSSTRPEDERWDPGTVEANAERAADDATTIAYLGELDQGASAVSLPVTNEAGILQVAPADGLTSYTRTPPGRLRAGPDRYYPGQRPTFVRLVPSDIEAARAIVRSLRRSGARRLAVLHGDGIADRELEAMVLALIGDGAPREVMRADAGDGEPEQVADLLDDLAAARPEALLYAGPAGRVADAVLGGVAARMPELPVYGGPPLARAAGEAALPARGCALTGIVPASRLPRRGRSLLAQLRRASGRPVGAEALHGYEAMRLVLDAIAAAGPDRRAVVRAARATVQRDGVLGRYAVTRRGDVEGLPLVCLDLRDG